MRSIKRTSSVAIILAFMMACTPNKSENEYAIDAKENISDPKTSILILKSGLSKYPNSANLRKALGDLYLTQGMGAEAEKEYTTFITLTQDINPVFHNLLKSYDLQGKSEELISGTQQLPQLSQDNQYIAYLYAALGYIAESKEEQANDMLEQLNDLSGESVYQGIGSAFSELKSENTSAASAILNEIIESNPELSEAKFFQAQLAYITGEYDQAIELLREYQTSFINDHRVSFVIAKSLLELEKDEEAEKELSGIISVYPNHPLANNLIGVSRYKRGDFVSAESYLTKALQNGLDDDGSRVLAGVSAYYQAKYEIAYSYLISVKDKISPTHPALKLLISLEMMNGNVDEAEKLVALVEAPSSDDDAYFIAKTGYEMLKKGDKAAAKTSLDKLDEYQSSDVKLLSQKALIQLAFNSENAIDTLEQAILQEPTLEHANVFLINAFTAEKKYERAINAAKEWQKHAPDNQVASLILASLYRKTNNQEQALSLYKEVYEQDNQNIQYLVYSHEISLKNGDFDKALNYLTAALDIQPGNAQLLKSYVWLTNALSLQKNAVTYFANMPAEAKNNPNVKLYEAQALFNDGQFSSVIASLGQEKPSREFTYSKEYWMLLGQSYVQSKEQDKAENHFKLWVEYEPNIAESWLALGMFYEFSGDLNKAKQVFNDAVKDNQDSFVLNIRVGEFALEDKNLERTKSILNKFSDNKADYLYRGLNGRVLQSERKFNDALPELLAYYSVFPTSKYATLIAAAYIDNNDLLGAELFIDEHLNGSPEDTAILSFIATALMTVDADLSLKYYDVLLAVQPKNVIALNNAAWQLYEKNQLQKAEEYIDTALSLVAKSPDILDTAAMIKLKNGKLEESKQLITKARKLAPRNKKIEEHYDLIFK